MDESPRYQLEINKAQAGVLIEALDLYMRIGMGQYTEIIDHSPLRIGRPGERPDEYFRNREIVRPLLDVVQTLLVGLDRNAYHSIGSQEIHDSYRVGCDLRDVIRHHLAWEDEPEGRTIDVRFDTPMHYGTEPLAKMSRVGEASKEPQ